jgi:anti-sigma B factor antagonist
VITEIIQIAPERVKFIEIVGRIDDANMVVLTNTLEKALASGYQHLILDLSGVQYMNSAGLREFVLVLKRLWAVDGTLTLVNPSHQVQRLLELVGLDTELDIICDPAWTLSRFSNGILTASQRHTHYFL